MIFLLFFSCKIRTMSDEELNALYDSIPAVRIYDMEYNDIVRGKVRYRAQSADAEMFDSDERNEIVIHSMKFEQFNNKGELSATGEAEKAVRFNATGNVEITDNIQIDSKEEEVLIEGNYLLWQDKDRILSGNITDEIRITKEDGTFFAGKGFYVDSKQNKAEFRNGVRGEYISESSGDETETDKAAADPIHPADSVTEAAGE